MSSIDVERLAEVHDELFLDCAREAVEVLNEAVDRVSRDLDDPSFDFSSVASRNVYQSPLYLQIVYWLFIRRLWERQETDVRVGSWALARALRSFARETGRSCKVVLRRRDFFARWGRLIARFVKVPLKMALIRRLAANVGDSLETLKQAEPLRVVDTYFMNTSFLGGRYRDRYHGPQMDRWAVASDSTLTLLPNLLAVKNGSTIRRDIRCAETRPLILCKERFLRLGAYVGAFWLSARTFFLKPSVGVCPAPILALIREELRLGAMTDISFEAHLVSAFTSWLGQSKLRIHELIDWNENHLYDRALWQGLRFAGLAFPRRAVQSVLLDPRHDFYIDPVPSEVERGLYPSCVSLPGSLWAEGRQLSRLGISIDNWPLYRLENFVAQLGRPTPPCTRPRVLIALPMAASMALELLVLAEELARNLPDWSIVVRFHPGFVVDLRNDLGNLILDDSDSASTSVALSTFVISVASSVCVEACAVGVPSLVYRPRGRLRQNPVPMSRREGICIEIADAHEAVRSMRNWNQPRAMPWSPSSFGF